MLESLAIPFVVVWFFFCKVLRENRELDIVEKQKNRVSEVPNGQFFGE